MLPPGRYLLSGALRRDPPAAQTSLGAAATGSKRRRAFNSMFVFDSDGRAADIYDKIHLVPFGEYLPWQSTLEAIGLRQLSRLRGGFSSGVEPRPLLNMGSMTAIAGLICYEAIFPGDVLPGTEDQDRPNLFINITNDGWFGNTIGPRQHFQQARVRTVETGIPLLRVANNGISAMIGPAGRSLHRLELNKRGTFDTRVPKPHPVPLYGRFGDWILIALLALMLGIALVFASLRSKP